MEELQRLVRELQRPDFMDLMEEERRALHLQVSVVTAALYAAMAESAVARLAPPADAGPAALPAARPAALPAVAAAPAAVGLETQAGSDSIRSGTLVGRSAAGAQRARKQQRVPAQQGLREKQRSFD